MAKLPGTWGGFFGPVSRLALASVNREGQSSYHLAFYSVRLVVDRQAFQVRALVVAQALPWAFLGSATCAW